MDQKDCTHEEIWFGSGDYYIFCNCGASWVRKDPLKGDVAAPYLANQGKGVMLSGKRRVEEK